MDEEQANLTAADWSGVYYDRREKSVVTVVLRGGETVALQEITTHEPSHVYDSHTEFVADEANLTPVP